MKNKDKYDLRKLEASLSYQINGCGKKIEETRTIRILYNNKLVAKIKDKNKSLIRILLDWLEGEE